MSGLATRAAVRRAYLLTPDGARGALAPALTTEPMLAPLGAAAATARLLEYLVEPKGRALTARDDASAAWMARSPLLWPCGPGAAAPLYDDLAAVVVAATFAGDDELPEVLATRRWAPRADAAIAAAVAAMAPPAGGRALARLRAPGPDESTVHQATLQAGRALAWAPHLHDTDDGAAVVSELLPLLAPGAPRLLLAQLMAALGPIARTGTAQGARVRGHARDALAAAVARLLAAGAAPADPALTGDWDLAQHAAHVLGAAAPDDVDGFAAWHGGAEALWQELPLMPAFLDGVVQAANTLPIAQLVIAMASGDDDDRALAADLACQLPVDDAAPALVALLGDPRPPVRVQALRALSLTGTLEPIFARLDDPVPEVAAAAALALVAHGESDRVRTWRPDEREPLRRAAIAAATGATDTETLGELAVVLVAQFDAVDDLGALHGSPLVDALSTALFTTARGLERAAALLDGIPEALPIVALALPRDAHQEPGVTVAPAARTALEAALAPALAAEADGRAVALRLLAGLACGDEAMAERVAAALAHDPTGAPLLAALAEVRVRTAAAAAALAPALAPTSVDRLYALGTAGRAVPVDDPTWTQVRTLLAGDVEVRTAAWAALRERVRLA